MIENLKRKNSKRIMTTRGNIQSVSGVVGKINLGTTPTPSWMLKHIPYSGCGLGKTPVRIPIKLKTDMQITNPIIPIKINSKFLEFCVEVSE